MAATNPIRILFLCTHNSARSQMAEGILRHLGGEGVEVFSAGTVETRVHPFAIAAMAEKDMDISGQRSKHMDEFAGERFDYVITVCDNASESCPIFPGSPERIHWSIPDPSAVEGSEEVRLRAFRNAADELTARIRSLLMSIGRKEDPRADPDDTPELWDHPDDALITWMLSLTPAQRLEALQGWMDSIHALRDGLRS